MSKDLRVNGYAHQDAEGRTMRTPKFFEEWARRHYMKPVMMVQDPEGDILLADSHEPVTLDMDGKEVQSSLLLSSDRYERVYRTGYAIHRSGLEIGNYNNYSVSDFAFMSRQKGIEKRVNEALAHARATQKQLIEAGFYDADRKGRFSIRPH